MATRARKTSGRYEILSTITAGGMAEGYKSPVIPTHLDHIVSIASTGRRVTKKF